MAERQKLIRISSRDRTNFYNTSSSKFTVGLGFDSHVSNVNAIQIKEIQFLNTAYNVNLNNNRFYFHLGGVEYSITVPPGNYLLSDFILEFDNQMLLHTPSITSATTFNTPSNKLNFNVSPAIRFYERRLNGQRNPMADTLGIRGDTLIDVGNHGAAGIYDLSGLKSLYVLSPQLSNDSAVSSAGSLSINVLDIVPITKEFGDLISHEPDSSDLNVFNDGLTKSLSSIDIELRDSNNDPVDLNGSHFDLIVKVFY